MYVIYKENKISQIGGVHPKDLEILANVDDWYLTECPDEDIHKYEEFGFIAVTDKEIAQGMIILDSYVDDKEDETVETKLSENDKKLAEKARKFIEKINNKIKLRAQIRSMKDMEDDLVDVKRMLYFLIDFIIDDFNSKSIDEKNKSKYNNFINKLKGMRNNMNIIEIEADLKKIEKYIRNEIDISNLVLDKYLNQGE